MYGRITTGTGIATAGFLPITGFNMVGIIVTALVLVYAGLALLKLLPKWSHPEVFRGLINRPARDSSVAHPGP
jgi:hypothetical protein